jgi:hypothetical protein
MMNELDRLRKKVKALEAKINELEYQESQINYIVGNYTTRYARYLDSNEPFYRAREDNFITHVDTGKQYKPLQINFLRFGYVPFRNAEARENRFRILMNKFFFPEEARKLMNYCDQRPSREFIIENPPLPHLISDDFIEKVGKMHDHDWRMLNKK